MSVLTFLFTDIEGSTRLLDADEDAMRAALETHNHTLREAVAAHDGTVFTYTGDGMCAVFAIRTFRDAGSFSLMSTPLVILATVFDRLGHYEPAATISAFAAAKPWARTASPEINTAVAHLRDVLGTTTYQPLANAGENMTNAEMAAYALDQIERARARVPK